MPNQKLQLIRGLNNCRQQHQNGVITIGNFDGLHLGHQKMLEKMHSEASRLNTHSCLMTFEPLPREYFSGDDTKKGDASSSRLMSRIEKIRTLGDFEGSLRPDYLLFLKFGQSLASMSAAEFIEQVLGEKLKIRGVIVGDDFRFGCDRKGDFSLLQKYGKKYQFSVIKMDSHYNKDAPLK